MAFFTNPKNAAIIAAIGAFVAVCKTWDTLAANEKWKIICGKIKKFIEILEDLGGHILLGITFIIFIMVYTICNDAVFYEYLETSMSVSGEKFQKFIAHRGNLF